MKKKKKRGKDSLGKNFISSWKYLKSSKTFINIIIAIFLVSAVVGFIFPVPEVILQKILEIIAEILEQTEGLNFWGLFNFIFLNNFKVSLMGFIAGILLGIFPVITAFANGYLLGFVGKFSAQEAGIFSLWRILPHGIFELPAIFIALGLGLKLGVSFFKTKDETFKDVLINSIKAFFFIVLPLLFIAALIESALIIFSG